MKTEVIVRPEVTTSGFRAHECIVGLSGGRKDPARPCIAQTQADGPQPREGQPNMHSKFAWMYPTHRIIVKTFIVLRFKDSEHSTADMPTLTCSLLHVRAKTARKY